MNLATVERVMQQLTAGWLAWASIATLVAAVCGLVGWVLVWFLALSD